MTTTNDNSSPAMIFEGRDAVTAYAFLAIRRSLKLRVEHGMSMMRNQEIRAAHNHGWSTARTAKKVLEDMNKIAEDCGLSRI